MNRKKIENWVIFGLKLLPFLMLAIFAIYCHRHTIDNTTVPDINNKVVSNLNFVYNDTSFYDIIVRETNDTIYYSLDSIDNPLFVISDGSSAVFYNFVNTYNVYGSFRVDLHFNTGDIIQLYFNSQQYDIYNLFGLDHFTSSLDDLTIDFDEFYFPYLSDFLIGDLPYCSYYMDYDFRQLELVSIAYHNIVDSDGYFFVSVDYTYENFDNVNPINASFIYFNNYLDYVMNFDFFNINDFYDWTVSNWFNNNPPLIYKPIFIILIYELLVDLLVLMYCFITFVIKFAHKWLNGIYNKDW